MPEGECRHIRTLTIHCGCEFRVIICISIGSSSMTISIPMESCNTTGRLGYVLHQLYTTEIPFNPPKEYVTLCTVACSLYCLLLYSMPVNTDTLHSVSYVHCCVLWSCCTPMVCMLLRMGTAALYALCALHLYTRQY